MKIGIPAGLLYHKYGKLWETFLKELDVEVIKSPSTNRKILREGLKKAESEICLPVKVFYGHVSYLIEDARVDAVFLPRMVAVEKPAYTCPKFLGLPDMIKATFPGLNIISEDFNRKLGLRSFYDSFISIGKKLGKSPLKTIRALARAEKTYHKHLSLLHQGLNLREAESVKDIASKKLARTKNKSGAVIGVAAHSYNIYDEYISMNLLKKIEELGASYVTPDNVPPAVWSKESKNLPKFIFWTYERELVGSAFYWIKNSLVDGIIYVLSFACGPDSIVQYVLEDEARKYGMPIMSIVIDEHSAEAGLMTRLEAFIDMLTRKKQ